MGNFLRRLWATLTTFPIYAGTLTAIVVEGSNVLAQHLPGEAATITHVGADVAAVVAFGSWAVTRLTPVAKELRGFPKAPLSEKEQTLADATAALREARAQIAALEATLHGGPPVVAGPLPDTITTPDPGPWKPPSVVAAEKAAANPEGA